MDHDRIEHAYSYGAKAREEREAMLNGISLKVGVHSRVLFASFEREREREIECSNVARMDGITEITPTNKM